MVASFAAYFSMHAFRKPINATKFSGATVLGSAVDLKTALLIGQTVGYIVSKFAGIVVCSTLSREARGRTLVAMVLSAELALAAFAVSSGVMKDIGLWLTHGHGMLETWMPAVVGALLLVPFVVAVRLLDAAPEPDALDEAARVPRRAMTGGERRGFLSRYGPGLLPLLVLYSFLTAYGDFRDDHGVEIFGTRGYADVPGLFTGSELPAAVAVLGALATVLFAVGGLRGMAWTIAVGIGSWLAYVPASAVLFDRLTAASGATGTAVFGIYVADATGYTGSVILQLYRDVAQGSVSRLAFFEAFSLHVSTWGSFLLVLSALLVWRALPRTRREPAAADPVPVPVPASSP